MNAKDIAYGYAIGYNDGIQNGGSGGGDTDTDPDYALWQALPEPASNQVIFVLQVLKIDKISSNDFMNIDDSDHVGDWTVPLWTIDWGDGIIDTVTNIMQIKHKYETFGRYTVICTALTDTCRNLIYYNSCGNSINNTTLMIKYGSDINCLPNGNRYYSYNYYLKYFKHKGTPTFRLEYFLACFSLKTVDVATPISVVYENMFMRCSSLNNINLSAVTEIQSQAFWRCGLQKIELPICTSIGSRAFENTSIISINAPICTSIGDSAFANTSIISINAPICTSIGSSAFADTSIISINAPICTSVGNYAFVRCYSLTNTVFADGCTFGNNAFQRCYSLYPHPDGSTD